ncbi:MAG: hypothetical protein COC04_00890 [Gammaproteobacteria bacterium]|nr:MAG: hypothetical protein COC04_00890 [Gammaproteobacteria bacterium]
MKLYQLATIKTNFQDADFWLIRRGSESRVGEPSREFYKEHIGIKVTRTDILLPDYLFYALKHIQLRGYWAKRARGSLRLVSITVEDVRNIELSSS